MGKNKKGFDPRSPWEKTREKRNQGTKTRAKRPKEGDQETREPRRGLFIESKRVENDHSH